MYQAILICLVIILIAVLYANTEILSKKELETLVINNKYFYNLSKDDLQYRQSTTHQEYIQKYLASYLPISFHHKVKLYLATIYMNTILPGKLKPNKWRFVQLKSNPYVECSFPHTLDNVIILVDYVLEYDFKKLLATLIHEAVHLYQRYNVFEKDQLLRQLGFFKENALDISTVANPDHDNDTYYVIKYGEKKYLTTRYNKASWFGGDIHNILIDSSGRELEANFQDDIMYQAQPNEIMAEIIPRVILKSGYVRPDWYNIIEKWLN